MRFQNKTYSGRQSGQALVETVIVMPVLIFTVLGIIQLTMMHQARLMLEYAAFNAARAGSVWNMDKDKMQEAAMMSLLPTFPGLPVQMSAGGIKLGKVTAISSYPSLAAQILQGRGMLLKEIFGDKYIVDVDVLSPKQEDFQNSEEIDFDLTNTEAERERTLLTIRLTYFYELSIPLANWIIFNSWYTARYAKSFFGMIGNNKGPFLTMRNVPTNVAIVGLSGAEDDSGFEGLTAKSIRSLATYSTLAKRYYIPLVTAHTIRMQSNPYVSNTDF